MALALTQDHQSLAEVARSFAAKQDAKRITRQALDGKLDAIEPFWKQVRDLGWAGLHLPERFGGGGYGLEELAVLLSELGAAAAPGPLLPAVIGSAALADIADDTLAAQLLPQLADGSKIAVVALAADVEHADGRASGVVEAVVGAAWADYVLVRADDDVLVLDRADASVTTTTPDSLDPALGVLRISLADTPVRVIAGGARRVLTVARTLAAAEASGGASATLGMALDYAKVREQFGRIIGSFQAIKHHLADMLVESERATATAWDAARASSRSDEQSDLAAAVAASVALRAYQRNAQLNIQIHGGIGFTWEHDAHLYLRRALTLNALLGSSDQGSDDVSMLSAAGVRRQYSIDLPPEAESFRESARAFVVDYRAKPEAERRRFFAESGYLVASWPAPWGRGAGPVEQLVIEQELVDIEMPSLGIGGWVLLTLTQHANAEQIERWIKPSLAGEHVWCQLFSEPGAGSDAAAVQTKAVRAEGGWVITGQKVWTSGAQHCDRGLATVRTDPDAPKHKGITTMVIDMRAKGVDVRPLKEMTGEAIFNEVFFDEVFVPDADVVGEVNAGWTVARATLGNERVSIGGGSRDGVSALDLLTLLEGRRPGDVGLLREIGGLIAAEQTLRLINLRQVSRAVIGAGPGAEGNVTKLLIAKHAQDVGELGMRVLGAAGVDGTHAAITGEYLMSRSLTIAGGTTEITKNVIAERLLGLPRDPLNK